MAEGSAEVGEGDRGGLELGAELESAGGLIVPADFGKSQGEVRVVFGDGRVEGDGALEECDAGGVVAGFAGEDSQAVQGGAVIGLERENLAVKGLGLVERVALVVGQGAGE